MTPLRGFFSSVRVATSRILVSVNVSHGAIYDAIPLDQLIRKYDMGNRVRLQSFLRHYLIEMDDPNASRLGEADRHAPSGDPKVINKKIQVQHILVNMRNAPPRPPLHIQIAMQVRNLLYVRIAMRTAKSTRISRTNGDDTFDARKNEFFKNVSSWQKSRKNGAVGRWRILR